LEGAGFVVAPVAVLVLRGGAIDARAEKETAGSFIFSSQKEMRAAVRMLR
jgi:hypothetical protein